jgi:hypothetical protein
MKGGGLAPYTASPHNRAHLLDLPQRGDRGGTGLLRSSHLPGRDRDPAAAPGESGKVAGAGIRGVRPRGDHRPRARGRGRGEGGGAHLPFQEILSHRLLRGGGPRVPAGEARGTGFHGRTFLPPGLRERAEPAARHRPGPRGRAGGEPGRRRGRGRPGLPRQGPGVPGRGTRGAEGAREGRLLPGRERAQAPAGGAAVRGGGGEPVRPEARRHAGGPAGARGAPREARGDELRLRGEHGDPSRALPRGPLRPPYPAGGGYRLRAQRPAQGVPVLLRQGARGGPPSAPPPGTT